MIWTEDQQVQYFLQGIMEAFRTGTWEAILLIGVIVAFAAILIIIFVVQNRRNYKKRKNYAESRFRDKIENLNLSAFEIDVLEEMAKSIPGGKPVNTRS